MSVTADVMAKAAPLFRTTTQSLLVLALVLGCQRAPAAGSPAETRTAASPATRQSPLLPLPTPALARSGAAGSSASISDVVARVLPSVVSVSSTRLSRAPQGPRGINPNDPFFRFFFGPGTGEEGRQPREQGLGSGVVVGDGIIVTNNHVVENADEIKVSTVDRHEFTAEIVGTDPKSDVAVLRVKDEKKQLRPLALGDSDRLRLGDVVLAIGNPFGVGQTVTMGIVSAKGRSDLGIVDYEDFIQTDAAINPGNSGGALVDMEGELVGINTAILSRSGGNMGIGFAIPTKMVRPIVDSLLTEGKVVRGWLGVTIQNLSDDLAQALAIPVGTGVLVADVSKESPAAKAGMVANDVIVAVDGKPISTVGELRNTIASSGANRTVKVTVKRGTKTVTLDVALSAMPEKYAGESASGATDSAANDQTATLGVKLTPLTAELRERLSVPAETTSGVVIAQVASGSPAERAGLRRGDVVLELGRRPVASPEEFLRVWKDSKSPVAALVLRGGNRIYLVIKRD